MAIHEVLSSFQDRSWWVPTKNRDIYLAPNLHYPIQFVHIEALLKDGIDACLVASLVARNEIC